MTDVPGGVESKNFIDRFLAERRRAGVQHAYAAEVVFLADIVAAQHADDDRRHLEPVSESFNR